jgi:hypothetical protein
MESIGSILGKYQQHVDQVKAAPHEKAASVDEIISLLGDNKTYNYTYWLRKVGSASYSKVLEIVKAARGMPVVMRGGYITNQLKPFAIKKTKNESTSKKSKNTGGV